MKISILYRPKSEHGRIMEDYVRDFMVSNPGALVQMVSLETRDGADMARTYDVTSYPAILVIDNNGSCHKLWQGQECPPLMQELASYSRI
jgi:hypothetical protein